MPGTLVDRLADTLRPVVGLPAVSVIVPARNASATLPATLDALAALTPVQGGIEVLVADDASTDDTRRIAAEHPVVTEVLDAGGKGPGAARNAAAAQATGAILAFTDADCEPDPGWLAGALAALDGGADLVQGAVDPAGPTGPFDRTVRVGQLSGLFETANLIVRREWFDKVGGFQPWLNPKRSKELGEDVWLGWRLTRDGARAVFAADARVRHAVFPGDSKSFVTEQARLRFFPAMVKRIPELRAASFHHRVFLNRRSEAFDIAVLGVIAAAVFRLPEPLLLVGFYVPHVWRSARPWGRRGPAIAAARSAGDAVGLVALIAGSIRARSVLL
jgi:glycosyltransferase involved in cell wall biosynthesis